MFEASILKPLSSTFYSGISKNSSLIERGKEHYSVPVDELNWTFKGARCYYLNRTSYLLRIFAHGFWEFHEMHNQFPFLSSDQALELLQNQWVEFRSVIFISELKKKIASKLQ